MRILVTGASGFLGRAIIAAGAKAGHHMIAVSRTGTRLPGAADVQSCGDLLQGVGAIDLSAVDAVVNCAALVHQPKASADAFHQLNTRMPIDLAQAAKDAGVRRFVQISSVAAVASETPPGEVLDDAATPQPTGYYGQTKLEADLALSASASSDFAVHSLRPPVLFGPGVGAHFAMLMRAAKAGVPLPLGAIRNRRSFAYVVNVAEAVIAVLGSSEGMVQFGHYIVTDSLPIPTAELYSRLLAIAGHKHRVWHWPEPLVRLPARIALGQRAQSLLGDAAFDGSRFALTFGWQPRVDFDEALRRTAAHS